MRIRNITVFTMILVLFVFTLFSCGDKNDSAIDNDKIIIEDKEIVISSELDNYVTNLKQQHDKLLPQHIIVEATQGLIDSNDIVTIRFNKDIIDQYSVNAKIPGDVVYISPDVKGDFYWSAQNTISFQPEAGFETKTEYKITLDLVKLNKAFEKLDNTKFDFDFVTSGRYVKKIDTKLKGYDSNDPSKVIYEGFIEFSHEIPENIITKKVDIKFNNKNIDYKIETVKEGYQYKFVTDVIKRDADKSGQITVKFDKKDFELDEDIIDTKMINPVQDFQIQEFIANDENKSIEIVFSDYLSDDQLLDGLISVKPNTKLDIKKIENRVLVKGAFQLGVDYKFTIQPSIKSAWGTKTTKLYTREVSFDYMKPKIEFLSNGVFMPSTNNNRIRFKAVNVKKIEIEVTKVFENNVGMFIQDNSLENSSQRYYGRYKNDVGIEVYEKQVALSNIKNEWKVYEIDFSDVIEKNAKGMYVVKIEFERDDMIYDSDKYFDNDYYENPNRWGYIRRHGRRYRPVIASDIGLTYKKALDEDGEVKHHIYATDLKTAKPLSGVDVHLVTFQNQIAKTGKTDGNGKVILDNTVNKEVQNKPGFFFIEAVKDNDRTIIDLRTMKWNTSVYDIGGVDTHQDGIKSFIYQERGVYRPGDEINFSLILRNNENTFPEEHYVSMVVYDPVGKKIANKSKNDGVDGFYSFNLKTDEKDKTGNWKAVFDIGSSKVTHYFKIETIVPYRLKVRLDKDKESLSPSDSTMSLTLKSEYLMGAASPNHKANVKAELESYNIKFNKFNGYYFGNDIVNFKPIIKTIFSGQLNSKGEAQFAYSLPDLEKSPSALKLKLRANVYEKGGRPVQNTSAVTVHPYKNYVGINMPEFDYSYAIVNDEMNINVVLVNQNGDYVKNHNLKYKIYKNRRYWWWEYDSYEQFKQNYKSSSDSKLVEEGIVISKSGPQSIDFTPSSWGSYYIEVIDEKEENHVAGTFFRASYWGSSVGNQSTENMIQLKTDKPVYKVGNTAVVRFPAPKEGNVLVTVEKGARILKEFWQKVEYKDNGLKQFVEIEVPITKDMLPNVYVSVSLLQPHGQTANDRPLRMYGIIPLNIVDLNKKQDVLIKTKEYFRPNEEFEIEIQTKDKSKTQFTIAVVDEGLLDITGFKTPDPYSNFYKKERLKTNTWDMYEFVYDAFNGEVKKTFSIGGGYAKVRAMERAAEKGGEEKRFKPVSFYQGPTFTNDKGYAKVKFKMPEYIGSVRIMVISANKDKYGTAKKAVKVKTELMVETSIPRFLGAGDEFQIPVTVFALDKKIKKAKVSLSIDGPIEVIGEKDITVNFGDKDQLDINYLVKVKEAIGSASISVNAVSGEFKASQETFININPSSPLVNEKVAEDIKRKSSSKFVIPNKGLQGSNKASITLSGLPNFDLDERLNWLIRYPYGCIEQTTSSVFPQLYLSSITELDDTRLKAIDRNINASFKRLRRFQLSNGSFSYWPGRDYTSYWGTNYATHYLIEAKKRGYSVPKDLYKNAISYLKRSARNTSFKLKTRVYKVFLLSLAGEADMGALNLLKENNKKDMDNDELWMLAAAYKLAGDSKTADKILKSADFVIKNYMELSGTYGSSKRDKGIILYSASVLEEFSRARKLLTEIADYISDDKWYSTQTLAYMLIGSVKYIEESKVSDDARIQATLKFSNGEKLEIDTKNIIYKVDLQKYLGQTVEVEINRKSSYKIITTTLYWEGIPLHGEVNPRNDKVYHNVKYYNNNGNQINPKSLKQGESFYIRITVGANDKKRYGSIDEMALVYHLPAGWEIDNTRLSGESNPNWMNSYTLNKEEYLDIRDDKIMWFFDLRPRDEYDFVFKVNVVTKGEFTHPPSTLEAMYDNSYYSVKSGYVVLVK